LGLKEGERIEDGAWIENAVSSAILPKQDINSRERENRGGRREAARMEVGRRLKQWMTIE